MALTEFNTETPVLRDPFDLAQTQCLPGEIRQRYSQANVTMQKPGSIRASLGDLQDQQRLGLWISDTGTTPIRIGKPFQNH